MLGFSGVVRELVGVAEVAELLGGVSRQRVDQLARAYPDFPMPAAALRTGRVWEKAAIERWIARHPDRRSGRPKKQTRKDQK